MFAPPVWLAVRGIFFIITPPFAMTISFPDHFIFGTSTSAAQTETATDHPWRGVRASDGHIFERTTDHEKRRMEDAELIARLGKVYRCGVDWARLQKFPMAPFESDVVAEYSDFFSRLRELGVDLMFVLHHFCHPDWFENAGGWTQKGNIPVFLNFAEQCAENFGPYIRWWNIFNEPNVYALNAFWMGNFPPFKRFQYFTANRVLDNMGAAYDQAYAALKARNPEWQIGISLNTGWFEGLNFTGRIAAGFVSWWFMERAARPFEQCDFWGLSYYAYMPFDPFPIDAVNGLEKLQKLGIPTDKMWGYRPEGLGRVLRNFYNRYKKPILIVENGICTDSDEMRIQSIRHYLSECHRAISDGVDLRGYIHWSTWDNFEWHLGPTYRFGLIRVDFQTMERAFTPAAEFFENIVKNRSIEI